MCIYYKSLPSDGACDPNSVRSDCEEGGKEKQKLRGTNVHPLNKQNKTELKKNKIK
jgi:hypothetical protein